MPGSFSSSSTPAPYLASNSSRMWQRAGRGNGLQIGGHAFADAGNLQQARRIARSLGQIHCGLLGSFGGAPVAADAKAVGSVDLQQIGRLRQQAGHGFVVHWEALRPQYPIIPGASRPMRSFGDSAQSKGRETNKLKPRAAPPGES